MLYFRFVFVSVAVFFSFAELATPEGKTTGQPDEDHSSASRFRFFCRSAQASSSIGSSIMNDTMENTTVPKN